MTLKDNNDGTFGIVAPCSFEKPKPLSDEEILNAIKKSDFPLAELSESAVRGMTNFARAIEERHGIK